MRSKTFATTISTTLIVAAIASVWAVTSPLSTGCAAASTGAISPAPAESAAFLGKVNEVRASKGLGALAVSDNLTSVATDWANHMAGQGALAHRPNLAAGVTVDWRLLGENVGRAPSVDEMMAAFINSPTHYKNLVEGSFTHVGIGTVRTPDGLIYSAHEFAAVKPAAAAPAPAPAPAPTTAPAPKVVAPKVVAQQSGTVVTAAAPAPSTTVVTAAPVVVVEHSVPDTEVELASSNAPAKSRSGC